MKGEVLLSEIRINFDRCLWLSDDLNVYYSKMKKCQFSISAVRFDSAFSMDSQRIINQRLKEVRNLLEKQTYSMNAMCSALAEISQKYSKTENTIANLLDDSKSDNLIDVIGNLLTDGYYDFNEKREEWSSAFSYLTPLAGGIIMDKTMSVFNKMGYEIKDDNSGATGWLYKKSAKYQDDSLYGEVNAYIGKGEAESKAEFSFMKTENKREYKNGEWKDKSEMTFLNAEAAAGVGFSLLAADAVGGIGDNMLGLEGKGEFSVGNASLEGKGKFAVGEGGVDAYVKGDAIVSAVEGKVDGTINLLGFEITGKAEGYAGALGVEGKVGIQDNKFVIEGGVAALVGLSVGVEIGFNEQGWDNFVDMITFWD